MITSDKRIYFCINEAVTQKLAMFVLPSIGVILMSYSAFVEYKDGSTHIFQLVSMGLSTFLWVAAFIIFRKIYNDISENCRFVQDTSETSAETCDKRFPEKRKKYTYMDEGHKKNMGVVFNTRMDSKAQKVEASAESLMNNPYGTRHRVTSIRVKLYLAFARVVLNAGKPKRFSIDIDPVDFYADQWEHDIMYVGGKKRQLRFSSVRIIEALSIVLRHGWPTKLLQFVPILGRRMAANNRICNDQSRDCKCKESVGVSSERYM